MSNKRLLLKGQIHHTLEVFRDLFKDSDTVKTIDATYESELMRKIDIIPELALEKVCKGTAIFKAFYKSISFKALTDDFEKLGFPVNLRLNVYELVIKGVDNPQRIKNSKARAATVAIIKYCKPILDCFTLALSDPIKYLKKIGETDLSEYDHLL